MSIKSKAKVDVLSPWVDGFSINFDCFFLDKIVVLDFDRLLGFINYSVMATLYILDY